MNRFLLLLLVAATAGCATPLIKAAHQGDIEEVKRLLAQGADVNQSVGPTGKNALTEALWWGGAGDEMVRILLDAGARVEDGTNPCLNCSVMTPLAWAVLYGHDNAARLLLKRGADPAAARAGLEAWGNTNFGFMDEQGERRSAVAGAIQRMEALAKNRGTPAAPAMAPMPAPESAPAPVKL